MDVHLVDGTYELFRYHFAPNNRDPKRGAIVGLLGSLLQLVADGATHVGVATDHIIESFRNDLWPDYKSSVGMPPELLAQFTPAEEALAAAGFAVWPQVEQEADDGLATAARMAATDPRVERVIICTPDKDLGQCVGGKVVQLDRRKGVLLDAAGVETKLGVPPRSVPDWLALVGDSADGFPGLPGWGAKSAAAVRRPGSRTSPTTRSPGIRACAAPPSSPPRCGRAGSWRCCSAASPPSNWTPPSAPPSTSCAGPAPQTPTSSPPSAPRSAPPAWSHAPQS
jgi:hypothetical protein